MSNVQENRSRFPSQPGYHPPGHPNHVPPCAFRYDFDKEDWRCACRAVFNSLDELSEHVAAYNTARRNWETCLRNEAHRKWMARREAS